MFRLPPEVLDEEVGFVLELGIKQHFRHYVDSLGAVLEKDYDAIFVGGPVRPGASDLSIPGRCGRGRQAHSYRY